MPLWAWQTLTCVVYAIGWCSGAPWRQAWVYDLRLPKGTQAIRFKGALQSNRPWPTLLANLTSRAQLPIPFYNPPRGTMVYNWATRVAGGLACDEWFALCGLQKGCVAGYADELSEWGSRSKFDWSVSSVPDIRDQYIYIGGPCFVDLCACFLLHALASTNFLIHAFVLFGFNVLLLWAWV